MFPYVNSYSLVLDVYFNIIFLKAIFFSIISSFTVIYHLYLPYDLFFNESVFITINYFLLFAMVNILAISRAGWKMTACIDKWTLAVSINKYILQQMTDTITGWILQQFSWMLQWINECWYKWVLLWYFLFHQLLLSNY